jgi:hypothetical protein
VSARIVGLAARTKYYVAVRPVNRCGIAGPLLTGETETQNPNFYTLSGCFVATAAYGTDLAPEVAKGGPPSVAASPARAAKERMPMGKRAGGSTRSKMARE